MIRLVVNAAKLTAEGMACEGVNALCGGKYVVVVESRAIYYLTKKNRFGFQTPLGDLNKLGIFRH